VLRTIVAPILAILFVFLFFLFSMLYTLGTYEGNYSGFLHIREDRLEKNLLLQNNSKLRDSLIVRERGYDGQFFYFMAFDPFLTWNLTKDWQFKRIGIDAPPYRYGRIGYPILTHIFSLNEPSLFPRTMIYLILASHLVSAFFLFKIARFYNRNPFWILLYILVPGFSTSLELALPESIAAAFLLGGIVFYLRKRFPLAIVFFAISILIRETSIIFVLVTACYEVLRNKNWRTGLVLSLSVIPYFFWRCYLTWKLHIPYGWEALFYSPKILAIPFTGIIRAISSDNELGPVEKKCVMIIAFFVCTMLIFAFIEIFRRPSPFSFSLLAYSLLYISLDYEKVWSHTKSIERTTYEGFLLCVLIFLSSPSFRTEGSLRFARIAVLSFLGLVMIYDLTSASIGSEFKAGIFLLRPFL
jgi:hypothetical protein